MILTYDQADKVHQAFFDLFPDLYPIMRRVAASRMVERGCEEIGSSDTSIELTEMFRAFEVPMVGPITLCYAECGIEIPKEYK